MRSESSPVRWAIAVVSLCATEAFAQTPPTSTDVRLAWTRAEGAEHCVGTAALMEAVAQHLGRDPFAPDAMRSVEAVVWRQDAGWVARIYVRDADGALVGSREITSSATECGPVSDAVALAVALSIDPEAALRAPPPPPPRPQASPPDPERRRTRRAPTARSRTRAPLPQPSPPALERPSGTLTGRALGSLGLLPTPAPGFAVAAEMPLAGRLAVASGVLVLPSSRTPQPDDGFAFGLSTGWLSGCVAAVRAPGLTLSTCAGAMAGVIHSVVYRPIPTAPGDRVWLGLHAGVRLAARLFGPLTLEVGLDAIAPLIRYQFRVNGRTPQVFQQPAVAAIGFVGLGLCFW